MGHKKSRHAITPPLEHAVLRRITRATTFLPDEIQYFYYDFLKYTPNGYLTLDDFERLYQTLFRNGISEKFAEYAFRAYDTNQDGIIDFEEFIKGLYYTTKASANEKIRWAFDLCDQDGDHQLDIIELENIIQALYELSDADMARIETYDEAIKRVKQLLLTNQDNKNNEIFDSITKSEFIDVVQSDATIMKLIDCQSNLNKRGSKFDNSTNLFKKQLKFKSSRSKSLSDSTLAAKNRID
ncbi:unnamed protein product [Rotaria sordida]|uniref:EF-hand domain-containing protein n=1 Tax=Rotaria sordida TaxID=392033 RepID=A0A813R8D6_9BILA|nr:unnamed protein product [Rotaria sordida]CAF0777552.1 unnamed protein product [Rotaria sordida]CAF0828927.1 unnamed protein product [Rotaria sordida]